MATAQQVIDRARQLINDVASSFVSGLRWSDAELLQWLTDGQREIVVLEPEANAVTDVFTVADGFPRQQLDPAIAYRLIRVEANGTDEVTGNLTAAAGCTNTSFGYRSGSASSNIYYPWCDAAGGDWSGDLAAMLPSAGALTLVVLQSLTSGVVSVLIQGSTPPAQNVFSSLSFVDKNGTHQTLLSSAATFTQYAGFAQSQWDWDLGSEAVLADAGVYTATFNP